MKSEEGGVCQLYTQKHKRNDSTQTCIIHSTAFGLNQQRSKSLNHSKQSPEIDIKYLSDILNWRILSWQDDTCAAIVYENVELAAGGTASDEYCFAC